MRAIAENTTRLSVSLNAVDYKILQTVAEKNDVSVAWVVRKAIERFIEAEPQGNLFMTGELSEMVTSR